MAAPKTVRSTLKEREIQEPQIVRPEPLRTLLEWKAPSRAFKKRGREYYTTLGAIAFLVMVILLLLQEWVLIIVIIALMFATYIMGTVPPQEVEHKITNRGVRVGNRNYRWQELVQFWFSEKWGQKILNIDTYFLFPQRLIFLLGEAKEEEAEKILSDYLPKERPEKTWVDKASDWLVKKVPLEKTS